MTTIKCPRCNSDIKIDIAKAIDEHGEVFRCPNCEYLTRYTLK